MGCAIQTLYGLTVPSAAFQKEVHEEVNMYSYAGVSWLGLAE